MREFRSIDLSVLVQGNNPRKHLNESRLQELAESVRVHGVIQPIIVKELAEGRFLVLAGERRVLASRKAGLKTIPARVLAVDDTKADELALVENVQRQDLDPLDEAAAYQRYLDQDKARTVNTLAAAVGKSKRYIYRQLKLNALIDKVKALVATGVLPLDYAHAITEVPADRQEVALDLCFHSLWRNHPERGAEHLRPLSTLKDWIRDTVRLNPRSEDARVLLPELAEHVQQLDDEKNATLLAVSGLMIHREEDRDKPNKPILVRSWQRADGEDGCEYARPAVIEIGPGKATFLKVCVAKDRCQKHWLKATESPADDSSVARSPANNGTTTDGSDGPPATESAAEDAPPAPVVPVWLQRQQERERWWQQERPGVLRRIAARTSRLRWTPELLQCLVGEELAQASELKLIPPLEKLPFSRYPQATAVALCVNSYDRDALAAMVKTLGLPIKLKELSMSSTASAKPAPKAPRAKRQPSGTRRRIKVGTAA